MTPEAEGPYSEVADAQLDALEAGNDPDLYNAVLDACEQVFTTPGEASAIQTDHGIRFRLPVRDHPPYKVFAASTPDGPRIETVFPHP